MHTSTFYLTFSFVGQNLHLVKDGSASNLKKISSSVATNKKYGVLAQKDETICSIPNENVTKTVQLPTVPLPEFSNVNAALTYNPSTAESSVAGEIKDNSSLEDDMKHSVSYASSTKTPEKCNESATQKNADVITTTKIPLTRGSNAVSNLSTPEISNTSSPILPSTPLLETDEQIRLENSSSSMSLSNVINFSASNAPSSPASYKTTASSLRPTSHPSATFSISSRSPSPAYSNPNSVTSSQDVILSEPGCGSGRPSVDSPAISATYSDMGNDVSDGVSQTSSVDQELKEEIIHSTRSESSSITSALPSQSSASPSRDGNSTSDLGLKIPVSEIDPSILPKTFTKAKLSTTITTVGRVGQNPSISTTLINKMRPPKGTVNLERSQEICQKAIAKSPNWVQVDPNVVGATLQQLGRKQNQTNVSQPATPAEGTNSSPLPNIILNSNNPTNVTPIRPGGPTTRPNLGSAVPISIRPSLTDASGSVQIMAIPATMASTIPVGNIRGASVSSMSGNANITNTVLVNAGNNGKVFLVLN